MKIRVFLAACVIALAGCASTANNGKFATDANILQGTDAAVEIAKSIYATGKMTNEEAQSIIDAANAILMLVEAHKSAVAAGDTVSAADYLRLASAALDQLTARLVAKQGK